MRYIPYLGFSSSLPSTNVFPVADWTVDAKRQVEDLVDATGDHWNCQLLLLGSLRGSRFSKVNTKLLNMPSMLRLISLLSYLVTIVSATALTYKLAPGEKSCFFSDVKQSGVKIAFYFAVSHLYKRSIGHDSI